jgi:hypothetical protein
MTVSGVATSLWSRHHLLALVISAASHVASFAQQIQPPRLTRSQGNHHVIAWHACFYVSEIGLMFLAPKLRSNDQMYTEKENVPILISRHFFTDKCRQM